MDTKKVSAAFAEAGIAHTLELTSSEYYDDRIVINEHVIVQVGRNDNHLCVLYDGCEIAAETDAFKRHASESQVLKAAIATVAEELMWIEDEDEDRAVRDEIADRQIFERGRDEDLPIAESVESMGDLS